MPKPMIEHMHPALVVEYKEVAAAMAAVGLPWILTSVLRTFDEQFALAAQGRSYEMLKSFLAKQVRSDLIDKVKFYENRGFSELAFCNALRKEAKLYLLDKSEWAIVTWTLKSRHLPDAKGYSHAFDGAIVYNGKPTWNYKVDANKSNVPDYLEYGQIVRSVGGLIWGGDFKKPDRPHAELKPIER